jgi:hypothetical protein
MRNAGLSEARCQNEVSESKAPAASNVTSKARRSRRVTDSLQADGVPFGGYKIDNRGVESIAARRTTCFKVDVGVGFAAKTRRAVKRADNFEVSPDWCSAKAKVASKSASRRACHRTPKKCAKRCPECLRSFVVLIKNKEQTQ